MSAKPATIDAHTSLNPLDQTMMAADPQKYGVVLVTAGSQAEAEAIAHSLITAHLAACVSLMPIQSVYAWQGKVCQEQEWQLIVKADLEQFSSLEAHIRSIHSYQVPEIIALPILMGSQPYLQWIAEQTVAKSEPGE